MADLKPCPFCGSKNVGMYDADSWGNRYAMCRTCRCRTEDKKSRALAAETWNRRVDNGA